MRALDQSAEASNILLTGEGLFSARGQRVANPRQAT
jgi:hypothetical protein